MKTARVQVLTTPAFRDWLHKEAKHAGVSVAELVRTRCERRPNDEEQAVAAMAVQLRKEVRKAQASLKAGMAEADAVLRELRGKRSNGRAPARV